MTLIILDPNLTDPHGHHLEWDLAIANVAREREQDVLIFAHKDCPLASEDGIEVVRWFSHSTYATKHQDVVTGQYDDFAYFNDALSNELALLPRERLRPTDAVLVPTLTEKHLLGYVCWIKTFDPLRAPLFVLYLMFPSGLDQPDKSGALKVADKLQALFYRLAFRRAADPGAPVHFFGGGRQLAREFSQLVGAVVEPHPIPNCPKKCRTKDDRSRAAMLLFAGDAKIEKGITLVPALAERLCRSWPDWDFLVHVNFGSAWGAASDAESELQAAAKRWNNLKLRTGRLSYDEYISLIEDADCMVSTYDPVVYARKSSGVVWEAISLGLPTLVPAGTWLENEAREWHAGYGTYLDWSAEGIAEAFGPFARRLDVLRAQSAEAAERYHAFNGASALLDQIGRLWVPRMLAASLTVQPQPRSLPLDELGGQGWSYPKSLSGRTVRWVGKSMEIEFAWPFSTAWRVELGVERFIGEDQITRARAFIDGQELAVSGMVNEDRHSGCVTVSGPGGGRDEANVRLRIELPWAYRPEHETRDLGLLIGGVHISPAYAEDDSGNRRTIKILTAVTAVERRGFLLRGAVSGVALMDPHQENWLHFIINTSGGPALARAVQLFVNGIPVRLEVASAGIAVWEAKARCDPNLVSRRGYHTDWDLVLEDVSQDAEVWIADLAVSNADMPRPALATLEWAPLPQTERSEARQGASADFASAWEPLSCVEPAGPRPLCGGEGEHAAFCGDLQLDEYVGEGNYRHFDISLRSVSIAGDIWNHVKFKFTRHGNHRALELRRTAGWPEMFGAWPSTREDRFGPLMLLENSGDAGAFSLPRDQLLLQAIFSLLPGVVEASAEEAGLAPEGLRDWVREARNISREWLHEMARQASGTFSGVAQDERRRAGERRTR